MVLASLNIITKMASRAQQTDDMDGENINYWSDIKVQIVYISFIKRFYEIQSIFRAQADIYDGAFLRK